MFGPPNANVQFKAENQQQGYQIKPNHQGNDGSDRAIEFVVASEMG